MAPKKDVISSRRSESWESFFELTEQFVVPKDFMADRGDTAPQKRDVLWDCEV
jgi:hypothetical protein